MPTPLRPSRIGVPPAPTATSGNAPSAVAPELPATPDEFAPGRLQPGALPVAPVDLAAVLAHRRGPDPYALVPGRYPDAVGLPQVLDRLATKPWRARAG